MSKISNLICPQCRYQNSQNSLRCSLCDWPLTSKNNTETLNDVDPNLTIDPSFKSSEHIDFDTTQANISSQSSSIDQYSTSPNLSIAEKRTFHLAGNLAHFEIHEILGKGGMGAVYHAKDRTLHRDVAIKMLRPMLINSQINTEALLDEARMASKLNHPNIVTIYDVARNKDSNYIVMEWVEGQSLDALIPDDGFELKQALEFACQIADGLSNAHQKYIIHRDIKPQNIMLSKQNTIKILDFGIAGYINNSENNSESQSDLSVSGTPSYMSPEQAQGLNLDQRSDIFSFGIVLYQMLTGVRPFEARDFKALKKSICSGNYIPIQQHLPELPISTVKIVEKMLAVKKDQRWQNSTELAQALHDTYDQLTHKKNWWQRRHWLSKVALILPFVLVIGWSSKEILFPASTQQLIQRQLNEATKIAILPFNNISGDPLLQLFSDGLAVNLGSDLSAIASQQGNTWIVPSTEISRMKDQSPQKVADKYGVNLILTGSIQHMGSTRLLVLSLLNADDGQQLKTAEVNINAEQLFQGQGKIRKQALALLNWSIPDNLKTKFNAQRPQLDGAYKAYVQGKGYLYRFDQKGNSDKALKAFQKAINMDSRYENAYVGLAEVNLRQFILTENVKWLEKMAFVIQELEKINPQNSQINFLSAELAMKKGKYKNAEKLYQTNINQYPNHIKSLLGLAKALNKEGKQKRAEQTYQKAIQISPHNWRAVSDFGIFYSKNGEYQKALTQFKRITELSPNNDLGFRNMAGIYFFLGDVKKAIDNTKIAIKLKPSDRAYTNLGTMLFSIKKYDESIVAFKKAVELKDSYYVNWGNLADSYKLIKNKKSISSYQNAVSRARTALSINPKDTQVMADLSYYLANLNEKKESLLFAEKIGELNTGWENFIVALTYDQLNNLEEVFKHLKIALEKNYPTEEIESTPLLENSRKDKRFLELLSEK